MTRRGISQEDVEWRRATLRADEVTGDMLIPAAEDVKVGYRYVCVKVDGIWFNWERKCVQNIVIDGKLYALHGDAFRRINCIESEEQLAEEKRALEDEAQKAKEILQIALSAVDKVRQSRLEKLDEEYNNRVGGGVECCQ